MDDNKTTPQQVPAVEVNVNAKKNKMQIIIIVLLTLLLILVGYLIYILMTQDSTEVQTPQSDTKVQETNEISEVIDPVSDPVVEEEEEEETPIETAKNVVPDGWKPVENGTYGYTAYRPSSYYYRFFGSQVLLGIDPNEIPTASEYAGAITITAISGSLPTAAQDYYASMTSVVISESTELNGTWTLVTANIAETISTPAQKTALAFIEVDGQVFVVEYRFQADSTGIYMDVFDQFYPSILFGT